MFPAASDHHAPLGAPWSSFSCATLCAAAATLLDFTSPSYYGQTESRVRDAIARSGRTTPANPDLLFLAIDSDSGKPG